MKYLTKEWFLTSQNTTLHESLIPSEEAAVFSEEYFKRLYRDSEQKYIDMERRIYGADAVDVEGEMLKFQDRYQYELDHLKYRYPSEILEKVADLRVLALEHATPNIIAKIKNYCRLNEAFVASASEADHKEFLRNWQNREPDFFEYIEFHDYRIISLQKEANDIVISLKHNPAAPTTTCRFKNAVVLKNDGNLDSAIWLYTEVYPIDRGYEIHILLMTMNGDLRTIDSYSDLIIQCSDVEIIDP